MRKEAPEGPGGGRGPWRLWACPHGWWEGWRKAHLNRATWALFQLQNRGETHIQGDVQDSDSPRVEVLPWALGVELRGR